MSPRRMALILAASAMALYLTVLSPLYKADEELRAQLPVQQAALLKYRSFVDKYTREQALMDEKRRGLEALERNIVMETDLSLATAAVQGKVQDLAASSGITLDSVRALSPVDEGGYRALPVLMNGKGRINHISNLLYMLDQSRQLLRVDKLDISSTRDRGEMRIQVQISGLMRNEE